MGSEGFTLATSNAAGWAKPAQASAINVAQRRNMIASARQGEEPAHVLPQQLGKALVQVGADGDVALVAAIVPGKLSDHPVPLFQRVALELHGARLQGSIGG